MLVVLVGVLGFFFRGIFCRRRMVFRCRVDVLRLFSFFSFSELLELLELLDLFLGLGDRGRGKRFVFSLIL